MARPKQAEAAEDSGPGDDDAPLEEDAGAFVPSPFMTRGEVSQLLRVVPRTVGRWTKEGLLKKDAHGRYSRAEVESFAASGAAQPTPEEEEELFGIMSRALALGNNHSERLLSLIEKPLAVTTGILLRMMKEQRKQTKQLHKRLRRADDAYFEITKLAGELHLQSDEREVMKTREGVKTALMAQGGENLMNLLPILLGQLMGGKKADAASAFVSTLTEQEKSALTMAGGAFTGEKQAAFFALLRQLGVIPPPPPAPAAPPAEGTAN